VNCKFLVYVKKKNGKLSHSFIAPQVITDIKLMFSVVVVVAKASLNVRVIDIK
jgi:hypothetical protein